MRSNLSEHAGKLIRALYAEKGFVRSLLNSEEQLSLIQQIADTAEPAVIPDLLPILIIGNKKAISACARAIHRLLQQLKAADFARFDEYVRQGYSNWRAPREPWYSIKPNDVSHLASLGEMSVSLLGIASCHTNGHVREEALRELGKTQTGEELPFLLIRANDWVEVIRSLVLKLLLERIRPDYLPHLLSWLPLALRLGKAGRGDHAAIIGAIRKLFDGPEAHQTLRNGFNSQDRFVRRFCYEIALHSANADLSTVLQRAFLEPDTQIRRCAVLKLCDALPNDELNEFLFRARRDVYMPVRREALRMYDEKYPDQAHKEFRSALLDSNTAIRDYAQYFFRRKGGLDLRDYYLQALETVSGAKLCAAIAGTGETGLPEDAKLIARFISSPSNGVRAVALHVLARPNPDLYLEQFLLSLADPSAKVTAEVVRALSKRVNSLGGERLWEIYSRCRYLHGRRRALFLLARIKKWDSITYLIQSLSDQDSSLVSLSQRYIGRWLSRYNRTFSTPSKEQLARVRKVLDEYRLLVSPEVLRQLDSLMQSF
jgi:HEAT repeat protein